MELFDNWDSYQQFVLTIAKEHGLVRKPKDSSESFEPDASGCAVEVPHGAHDQKTLPGHVLTTGPLPSGLNLDYDNVRCRAQGRQLVKSSSLIVVARGY